MALIVPTAYIRPPHGTSRRTFWFGVLLSNQGVFVEGTLPTVAVAAFAGVMNPTSTAQIATPAQNTYDFRLIFSNSALFPRQRCPRQKAERISPNEDAM